MNDDTAGLVDQWILTFLETPALGDPDLLKKLLVEHQATHPENEAVGGRETPIHRTLNPSGEVASLADTPEYRPDTHATGARKAPMPSAQRQA